MYCDWPDFGRCCFCLPLRRGVMVFACLYIFFSAFMVGIYSHAVHVGLTESNIVYHGATHTLPSELCVAIYCLELLFNTVLIYGTYKKSIIPVKAYYYFAVTTVVVTVLLPILAISTGSQDFFIELILTFSGLCVQLYLIALVRSLIKKLELSEPQVYENQLHQIVTGEIKVENNGVYNTTTVVPNDA